MTKSNLKSNLVWQGVLLQTTTLFATLFLLAGCLDISSFISSKGELETEFQLTFDSRGGSAVSSQVVTGGLGANEPTPPSKSGYTFAGWYKDTAARSKFNFNIEVITRNTTLYAKWSPVVRKKQFQLTFDSRGGSAVSNQVVTEGQVANEPTPPSKPNHGFAGWYKDTALSREFNFRGDKLTNNTRVYAKWRISSGPKLLRPIQVAVKNGIAYVIDDYLRAVVKVDLKSGDRTILSSANVGTGPAINPKDIAIADGVAVVTYGTKIFKIDLDTGNREVIADEEGNANYISGFGFLYWGLAVHDGFIYLSPWYNGELIKISLQSGVKTLVSRSGVRGSGPAIAPESGSGLWVRAITILDGAAYIVTGMDSIIKVELSSGNRSIFSRWGVRPWNGPWTGAMRFFDFVGLEAHNGELYAVDGRGGDNDDMLVKILPSGRGVIVSYHSYNYWSWDAEYPRGSESRLNRGRGVATKTLSGLDIEENAAYSVDEYRKAVIKIDLSSGDRTIVSQ